MDIIDMCPWYVTSIIIIISSSSSSSIIMNMLYSSWPMGCTAIGNWTEPEPGRTEPMMITIIVWICR